LVPLLSTFNVPARFTTEPQYVNQQVRRRTTHGNANGCAPDRWFPPVCCGNPELAADVVCDPDWHGVVVGAEEAAILAERAELQREAEPHVVTAAAVDLDQVGLGERPAAGELLVVRGARAALWRERYTLRAGPQGITWVVCFRALAPGCSSRGWPPRWP
jgi:hypothetical protein